MARTRPIKIDLVVGARPNFVKAAAILEAAKNFPVEIQLIHTGQHDMCSIMSEPHFRDLNLPQPDCYHILKMFAGATTIERMSMMINFLGLTFISDRPEVVMVVGDTDSTLAGAITAAKMRIPVVHVEAGLRCGDLRMQEEINRILVDSIATRHYTTSCYADANLKREGKRGIFVGNVMIDSLRRHIIRATALDLGPETDYAVLTLHRAENVDDADRTESILDAVEEIATQIPVIWPTHPRYSPDQTEHITMVPPKGYLDFLALLSKAKLVLTDSGGVQEEASALGVPCLTLRDSTERPETVFHGTNHVVGAESADIIQYAKRMLGSTIDYNRFKPEGYDGHAAERLLGDLCRVM